MKLFHAIATSVLGTAMAIGAGFAVAKTQEVKQAKADNVTFVAGTDTGDTSVEKSGITVSMSTMSRDDNYRVYASTDMVVESTVGNMTSIEITCTGSGNNNYGPGKLSGTGYTSSGTVGTWTGESASVTLSASAQVRITQIVVTYTASGGGGGGDPIPDPDPDPDPSDKITDYNNIVAGQYYIGSTISDTDYYFYAADETAGESKAGTSVDNKNDATVVTLAGSGNTWSVQLPGGNYLSLKNDKDNGKYSVSESAVNWTFSNNNDDHLIKMTPNGAYYLQKNTSAAQFGSYKNTQQDVWLEAVQTKTLQSIALTKDDASVKKSYTVGQDAAFDGLTVMATYDVGDPVNVTSKATITANPSSVVLETTSITYTATFGGKTSNSVTVTGITVSEVDYAGTYVLASNGTTYTTISSEELFHSKISNSEIFAVTINGSNLRVGGSPNTSDIMVGSNDSNGTEFTLTIPNGYAMTKMVFNGYASNSSGSKLTVEGFTQDVASGSPYVDYAFYPLSRTATISSASRVWTKSITITVVKSTATSALASAYSEAFIAFTKAACSSLNVTADVWNVAKQAFVRLQTVSADAAQAVKELAESDAAIARYKFCIQKYGTDICEDFLAKGYTKLSGARFFFNNSGNANYTLITIIAITVTAISLIGVFLIIRKRKHQ